MAGRERVQQGGGMRADILLLGAALPPVAEEELRRLCSLWETIAASRLSAAQARHIRRFRLEGEALRARASRLAARLLLMRGMEMLGLAPEILDRDNQGRPLIKGCSASFSHSGQAAFCALAAGENLPLGVDAEARDSAPPAPRAFSIDGKNAPTPEDARRRWIVKEALGKALGTGIRGDPALMPAAKRGQRAGVTHCAHCRLAWRILPYPGHWLAVAHKMTGETNLSPHWCGMAELPLPRR